MDQDARLRRQLSDYLEGGHAHKTLKQAVDHFPAELINQKLEGTPYTFWHLLEHIRITQNDVLEFLLNPNYVYLDWPQDYWPDLKQRAGKKLWDATLKEYCQDLELIKDIVKDKKVGLLTTIPHGEGQTVLREILLVVDHTSYHTGEIILMRRAMKGWKD